MLLRRKYVCTRSEVMFSNWCKNVCPKDDQLANQMWSWIATSIEKKMCLYVKCLSEFYILCEKKIVLRNNDATFILVNFVVLLEFVMWTQSKVNFGIWLNFIKFWYDERNAIDWENFEEILLTAACLVILINFVILFGNSVN